ncbi:hypothetical protein [Leptolyngbya sp. 7M]|uniref:hypothetical protein n=1 Tax=Leptolyngbya sp. 7M TaxID=2812896 RepID=UPI001B8D0ED2|nr:hypothetical protein [Leptolyngbya sp. 7M]QYO67331.1 hypothetical protein JVX88_11310 [Leptolyngbya sp. 7M]
MAFPPPPVTFPATRLSIRRRERLSTFRADHFSKALSVFIRTTQVTGVTLASLSASIQGVARN